MGKYLIPTKTGVAYKAMVALSPSMGDANLEDAEAFAEHLIKELPLNSRDIRKFFTARWYPQVPDDKKLQTLNLQIEDAIRELMISHSPPTETRPRTIPTTQEQKEDSALRKTHALLASYSDKKWEELAEKSGEDPAAYKRRIYEKVFHGFLLDD